MELALLQTVLNIVEVMGTFLSGLALVAIAICAVIHIVRTSPERQAKAFREVFKIRGMGCLIIGLLLLAAAAPASAKPKIWMIEQQGRHCWYSDGSEGACGPKHFFTDKKWWAGEAVIVASTVLDANSTCRAVSRGAVETNMILGQHPSCTQASLFGLAAASYWTTVHAVDWHFFSDDSSRTWRTVGYTAIPVAAAAIHLPAAINNYEFASPKPPVLCEHEHHEHDCD